MKETLSNSESAGMSSEMNCGSCFDFLHTTWNAIKPPNLHEFNI